MWLREFRTEPHRLSEVIFWDCLEDHPGIVRQKDGSLLAVIRFRGPDLASAVDAELVAQAARLNNCFKRFGSGWALLSEAQRREVCAYPSSPFPDALSARVDAERQGHFLTRARHYATETYLTLVYAPPRTARTRWREWLYANLPTADPDAQTLTYFQDTVQRTVDLLRDACPEADWLVATETAPGHSPLLTYLHSTVSPQAHPVGLPAVPAYLAEVTDTDVYTGLYPSWGDPANSLTFQGYLACVSVRGYPATTFPGVLGALEALPLEYRAVLRYLALDTPAAVREIYKYRRKWVGASKRTSALITERVTGQGTQLVEHAPLAYAEEAAEAQAQVQRGAMSFGYCTNTVVLWDRDFAVLQRKVEQVTATLDSLGCTSKVEDLNAFAAWRGTIPGDVYSNVRRPLLHSLNVAHLFPATSVWRGPTWDAHLHGPPLFVATGRGQTPVHVSLHDGDVGHVGVIGRTGNGKSTLLNFLCLQWQRYPQAETVIFDKGGASRALTAMVGGAWHDLGMTPLQPLANLDRPAEIGWALDWLDGVLDLERLALTPDRKEVLYIALQQLATEPRTARTLSGLVALISDPALKQALRTYTQDGPYGTLLDADADWIADHPWLCFELETLLETPRALNAVLPALFHRLEQRLTGVPVRYFLHEGWLAFDTPYWATRMRGWLKGFRVKNASVVIATQSLADAVDSKLMPALLDNVPTWIYTANSEALTEEVGKYYKALNLNEREREVIATAVPKREYYLTQPAGKSLFRLDLGPVALAACKTPGPAELRRIAQMVADDPKGFMEAYLQEQGVSL